MTNPLVEKRDRFAASHPEQQIVVNGRKWGVLSVGDSGPGLVLLPGTLGRGDIFWQQIETLEGRAQILALSYPATGGILEWADDIATLMYRHDIETAHILGTSLGGYVAQYFTATRSERTESLIAANTLSSVAFIGNMPPYSRDLDAEPAEVLHAGFTDGLVAWAKKHPEQQDLVDLLLNEVANRIPDDEIRARLKALKYGPELPPPALPPERVAVVESGDDPLIPPPMREAVQARLAPGRVFRFIWGGHFPYVVRPSAYTALIEQRLALSVTGEVWPDGTAVTEQ